MIVSEGNTYSIKNPFLVPPATYLGFVLSPKEIGLNKGILDFDEEAGDIALLSYNITPSSLVVIITLKDVMGKNEGAILFHVTPTTFKSFSSLVRKLRVGDSITRAYLIGDEELIKEASLLLEKKGIEVSSTFTSSTSYQHLILWSDGKEIYMKRFDNDELPEEIFTLLSRVKNPNEIVKSVLSLKHGKLNPAFEKELLEKQPY